MSTTTTRVGPIEAARIRARERSEAIIRDARRATMAPGPGARPATRVDTSPRWGKL